MLQTFVIGKIKTDRTLFVLFTLIIFVCSTWLIISLETRPNTAIIYLLPEYNVNNMNTKQVDLYKKEYEVSRCKSFSQSLKFR
jgi:hypothetical protein